MKRPESYKVVLTGVAIIVFLAIFTPVTWLMGLTAGIFLLVGLIAAEGAISIQEANVTIEHHFCSALIMLVIVCWATANWWLLPEYGLPMFIGLIYPMIWYDAAQTEQLQ